jgi:hypothetical protein
VIELGQSSVSCLYGLLVCIPAQLFKPHATQRAHISLVSNSKLMIHTGDTSTRHLKSQNRGTSEYGKRSNIGNQFPISDQAKPHWTKAVDRWVDQPHTNNKTSRSQASTQQTPRQILIPNPYSTYRAHRRQHSAVPSVSYGDFSESQLAARVDALLRAPPAALATSSSTNAGGPGLEGTRKLPPSAGTNPSRLALRPAAADEE